MSGIQVINDFHLSFPTDPEWFRQINSSGTIVLNGDFFDNGKSGDELKALYYEGKRSHEFKHLYDALKKVDPELDVDPGWIDNSIHSGTFLAKIMEQSVAWQKVFLKEFDTVCKDFKKFCNNLRDAGAGQIILSPGNAEVSTIFDFDPEYLDQEKLPPYPLRKVPRLDIDGFFKSCGVDFVDFAAELMDGRIIILPVKTLDHWNDGCRYFPGLSDSKKASIVISHYPPWNEEHLKWCDTALDYHRPKEGGLDHRRMTAVKEFMYAYAAPEAIAVSGHIHPPKAEKQPTRSIGNIIWVKPRDVYMLQYNPR